jgi:glycosyltransferase involved in cell wall biosynthesis
VLSALHLFANHKVTGPAELALETARAVARTGRVEASFFSSDVKRGRYRDRWLQLLARERGVAEPAGLEGVRLAKHLSIFSVLGDVKKLARHLDEHPPSLVHCHLPNDHLLAAWAIGKAKAKPKVVRTLYDGEPPAPSWRTRRTLAHAAAILCLSKAVAASLVADAARFGIDPLRVRTLEPPIDATRFDPARPRGALTRSAKRAAFGIPDAAFCLGIVARMQTHRRFEVLLEALRRARSLGGADLRLLIVGRGTNQDAVAREPVRAMGLSEAVVFSGYQSGEDYVATLAAMDAKVFLVPGSDGTCRAVREALAMGVPVIAAKRGILPELVKDGETGLLVEDEVEPLARAIASLAADPARRAVLGARAREDALARFSFDSFGRSVVSVYEEITRA